MPHPLTRGAVCAALLAPLPALAGNDAEIAELRSMLNQMKSQYERRIADLEARLQRAEENIRTPPQPHATAESLPMTAPLVHQAPPPSQGGALGALTSGNAFNPEISVILDGNYYQDGIDGRGATLMGEAFLPGRAVHLHEEDAAGDGGHVTTEDGFNFRSAEIAFSGTVDPYFDARALLSVDGDGNLDLEEAYFQTRTLPYGLKVKGGKFLSDFGYINRQHPHQWDFVDQNLPYLNLIGDHGIQDTGLQLTWLPELPVYTLLGVEALQGNQEVFGTTLSETEQAALNLGDTNDGPRLWTAFVKVAPDLGVNHALQLGVSYVHATQHQQVLTHSAEDASLSTDDQTTADGDTSDLAEQETGLAGNADLWGVDLVYKYDGGGAQGHRDFKLQTEYLRSIRDLSVRSSAYPEQLGSPWKATTDGLYAQAVYGFAPKWNVGLRYDILGITNTLDSPAKEDFGSSDRWTVDVTWDLSEFSRLRAQYATSNVLVLPGERERFGAFYLQFLMSLGAHGAHGF